MYSQELQERYDLSSNAPAIYEAIKMYGDNEQPSVVLPLLARINADVNPWALYEDALKVSQEVSRIELLKRFKA